MMLSMFVNDRRDNWNELLPFVMHAYRTSVRESPGYSPFRLLMGEECSLPQDVSTDELLTNREHDVAPHPFATWVQDALEVAYHHVRHSLHRTAAQRKRLYDVKAVNRKFPVGSWVLRYYPPAAQKKLGSPWIGPQQVVRQATSHTVGIQKEPEAPIVFIHVDDLKIRPPPSHSGWTPSRRQQSHYVPAPWLSDRAPMLAILILHHLWTCLLGIIRTHHYLVLTFTLNWTNPLI